jgi:hypothetical protein
MEAINDWYLGGHKEVTSMRNFDTTGYAIFIIGASGFIIVSAYILHKFAL